MGILKKRKKKPDFYNLDSILAKNATYNVIFGERSNGKTFACLEKSIVDFYNGKNQVAYIRRWKEDTVGKRARQIFMGLNESGKISEITKGEYTNVIYRNGCFYLCTFDETNSPIYNTETDCLGYLFALSDVEHDKSTTYPNVTNIVFDEFLTRQVYLQDEFITFMNTVSTIIRQRTNVTIFMLGNTVNRFSPYFQEMGLSHVKDMKQGTIDIYRYGDSGLTVAVEYCESLEKSKENNFYFAFNNPKLEMITGGAWELNIYPHVPMKYKPKNILFTYFIEFNDNIFQCEIVGIDDIYFTYIHEKTTPIKNEESDLIYTFDYNPRLNYNRNVLKPISKLQEKIAWFFRNDRVYYQNNEVGDSIHNYLKICKAGKVV